MITSTPSVGRRLRLALAAAACLVAALTAAPAASAAWSPEPSATTDALRGVSCPTESRCYAVGDNGRIVATSNGGASWTAPSSGTTLGLRAIACPSAMECVAIGASGGTTARARATSNGWASWSSQLVGSTVNFNGVSCASMSFCLFVGDSGRIVTRSDGSSGSSSPVVAEDLFGTSCFTASACWAVGEDGRIVRRTPLGDAFQPSGTTDSLYGVSCPTATTCWAVGAAGRIVATADGGTSWRPQASGITDTLRGVSCPTAVTCWAVGDNGRVVYTTNGGVDWATDVSGVTANLNGISCASAFSCRAVGDGGVVLRYHPSDYPSNDCDAGTAMLDGFIGDVYYKLRTAPNPADPATTWVCVAVDAEGEHRGGKVLVSQDAANAAAADDEAAACDADAANRLLNEDGQVGPIPFELEVNQPSGEVWVCISANGSTLTKRLVIATGSLPSVKFLADAASPYPYPETPSVASASAACQAAPSSSRERLVNAQVGPSHVWLYTWSESASRTHVCTRVDDAGGRLTLDGNGSQTIASVDSGTDFTPCDSNVLTLTTPPISSKVHVGGPAWACLRADSTSRRVKLDAGGGQGVASFTPDG